MSPGIGSQACWKEPKGSYRLQQLEQAAKRRAMEQIIKRQVRARDDHRCRVPGCEFQTQYAKHVAHLDAKGMGGDKRLDRTRRDRMLLLCWYHHEGPISHHSKDLRIEPETAAGTDGPCLFWVSDEQAGWRSLGVG